MLWANSKCTKVTIVLTFFLCNSQIQCRRIGGGFRSRGGSFKSHSPSRINYSPASLSYSPTFSHSQFTHQSIGFVQPHQAPSPPRSQFNHNSHSQPPPIGFKPPTSNIQDSKPPPIGFKPITSHQDSKPSAMPTKTSAPPGKYEPSAPVGPPTNVRPNYNSVHNPAGYGPLPPAVNQQYGYPQHNPAGYGPLPPAVNQQYGYPQHNPYHGAYNNHPGVTNININNINTNHHSGYMGGGGGWSMPSYHYTENNVGSGTLGFFLGYSLAKITTPSFSSPSLFHGYRPMYDHYEVHHYYHNKDSIPTQSNIEPNAIVGCVGNTGSICPSGTYSLCTSNSAILCVASASSTVPCSDQNHVNCVKTVIPCVNGTMNCQEGQNSTSIILPCVSKATVPANITYVNNTIIVNNNNTTVINNNGTNNGTFNDSTTTTNSSITTTRTDNTTVINNNGTVTDISEKSRQRREMVTMPNTVNELCVTILALPAERKISEQQQVLQSGVGLFSKFLIRALGAQ